MKKVTILIIVVFVLFFPSVRPSFADPQPSASELADQWLAQHNPRLLTPADLQKGYETLLRCYFVPQTGLFLSFPRTNDLALTQQVSIYDQGVVGLFLLKVGDVKTAGAIVKFFENAWVASEHRAIPRDGKAGLANFYNAYYFVISQEGIEKTVHVGPNAWIGLLASRYYRMTGDPKALELALNIMHWIIFHHKYVDGAVAMGEIPWNGVPWDQIFSTENNVSTHAFLMDLLKAKGLGQEDHDLLERVQKADKQWLVHVAYDPKTDHVLRGGNTINLPPGQTFNQDHVQAIDSYTWYVDEMRPPFLRANGVNADAMMGVAHNDFVVKVGGLMGVDVTDQGGATATYEDDVYKTHPKKAIFYRPKGDNHRLLWWEATCQYIVTLQYMARDSALRAFSQTDQAQRQQLLDQASRWLDEAKMLVNEMDKSGFFVPGATHKVYELATPGRFYIGAWPAPEPTKDHPADAVTPLCWRFFAGMGFESLTDEQIIPTTQPWSVKPITVPPRDPGPILYGASEEMQERAWKLFEKGDYDLASRQAQALIDLWGEDAIQLEKLKKKEQGTFMLYKPGQREQYQAIHNYWALNDVAAAYYILGEIADQQHRYAQANQDFSAILTKFQLAQLWSTKGYFWNPAETIKEVYVFANPKEYGNLLPLISAFSPPTALTAKAGNTKVFLSWKAPRSAISYNVERAAASGGPYTTIANSITDTTYTDTFVTNGTVYYYIVSALYSAPGTYNRTAYGTYYYVTSDSNFTSQARANSNEVSVTPQVSGDSMQQSMGTKSPEVTINQSQSFIPSAIDFGDYQSSTLVSKAQQALGQGDIAAVLAYTDKTISLYAAQAAKMEADLPDYTCGFYNTSKYQALNDVATSLFLQGEAYQLVKMNDKAKETYERLIKHYFLGQSVGSQSGFVRIGDAAEERLDMMTEGINFGDRSSSTLTKKAWLALAADDPKDVEAFVNKAVELYGSKAKDMQASMKGYATGSNGQISRYWALNDVGTSLFILGQNYQKAGNKQEAIKAYKRVINEFSYAQTWDQCRFFWKPADAAKANLAIIESGTNLDFGDYSSLFLVLRAWASLKASDLKGVQAYVDKTLELYGQKAKDMQASLNGYAAGSNDHIFKYWALNDVGTALYILGRAYENAGHQKEAIKAYKRVVNEFSYAQCWDTKGFFWKPADAAKDNWDMITSGVYWNFGDHSSMFLVRQAQAALKENYLKAVEVYVNETLKLYGQKAKAMQASLKGYPSGGNDQILRYRALNDVGEAVFILGQAYENAGHQKEAAMAYQRVVREFSYAQCRGPAGWFWKPAEAAQQRMQSNLF